MGLFGLGAVTVDSNQRSLLPPDDGVYSSVTLADQFVKLLSLSNPLLAALLYFAGGYYLQAGCKAEHCNSYGDKMLNRYMSALNSFSGIRLLSLEDTQKIQSHREPKGFHIKLGLEVSSFRQQSVTFGYAPPVARPRFYDQSLPFPICE